MRIVLEDRKISFRMGIFFCMDNQSFPRNIIYYYFIFMWKKRQVKVKIALIIVGYSSLKVYYLQLQGRFITSRIYDKRYSL